MVFVSDDFKDMNGLRRIAKDYPKTFRRADFCRDLRGSDLADVASTLRRPCPVNLSLSPRTWRLTIFTRALFRSYVRSLSACFLLRGRWVGNMARPCGVGKL